MKPKYALAALLLGSSLAGTQVLGKQPANGPAKDAWIGGKIEAVYALNTHLSAFAIDTDVTNGAVHLTGTVQSDIQRDLAGELAEGIDGVTKVDNDLKVAADARRSPARARSGERTFGEWFDDATTTAAVKSELLANANTKGLQIDVDTRADVVTLAGEVGSAEEKQLAEQLARNTGDVKDVRNRLTVRR